jgi:ABC-2 type transport system ATP-binding protein
MSLVLTTNRLTKRYAANRGCTDITLSVEQGRIFGLLGPNGAGKSTFVKMLVGLLAPTSGEASLLGLPLGHPEGRRKLGYLPELFRYPDWLTADEVVRYHARLSGMETAGLESRIESVLMEVGLGGVGKRRVKQFSKGMQQRLGLGCALVHEPDFVILDEPSSALDPIGRYEVRHLLEKLRSQGKSVFLNTHLLEDVEALCDEVAFLHEGTLRALGSLQSVLAAAGGGEWELTIGGWLAELEPWLHETASVLPGMELSIREDYTPGEAVITVKASDREQIGWLNAQLIEHGMVLYEAKPLKAGLEDWFVGMTQERSGP